jgi:TatD DNase family protein
MAYIKAKQSRAPSEECGFALALEPSAAPIIDIGVNLAHKSFQSSLPDIISRAYRSNVTRMIITGTTVQSSRVALNLTERYKEPCQLFSTAGTHPHYAKDCAADWVASTRRLLEDPRCVAVGECGLDFNRNFSPPEVQEAVFEAHLRLAAECGKPLFCHEREAHARFLAILDRHPDIDGSRCPNGPAPPLRRAGSVTRH